MSSKICVILLAGGTGSRMKADMPKQFLLLKNKPMVRYSFELFLSLPNITELVVVCAPSYRHYFEKYQSQVSVTFAMPGERRQDSVYNGLQAMQSDCSLVCIHDGARPFITASLVQRVIEAGQEYGAATVGMPIKFTVKQCDQNQFVTHTPNRNHVWEIQTPQVIHTNILKKGFAQAYQNNETVTDDVSLVERLNHPVKLVEGCYKNIKITTSEDLAIAESLL